MKKKDYILIADGLASTYGRYKHPNIEQAITMLAIALEETDRHFKRFNFYETYEKAKTIYKNKKDRRMF